MLTVKGQTPSHNLSLPGRKNTSHGKIQTLAILPARGGFPLPAESAENSPLKLCSSEVAEKLCHRNYKRLLTIWISQQFSRFHSRTHKNLRRYKTRVLSSDIMNYPALKLLNILLKLKRVKADTWHKRLQPTLLRFRKVIHNFKTRTNYLKCQPQLNINAMACISYKALRKYQFPNCFIC